MNYLKLIYFKRRRIVQTLLMCITALIFTACGEQKTTTSTVSTKADSLLLLPGTYITTEESNKREDWFNNHKLPIINDLTINETGIAGTKKLNFDSLTEAILFFDFLVSKKHNHNKDTITGVRIYFASPPPIKQSKSGKLTLIFNATHNGKLDVQNYYAFRNGKLDTNMLELDTAKAWVRNYQLNIRRRLSSDTMDPKDVCRNETKHIWFSKKQIESVVAEIKYQIKYHSDKVDKIGVRFTSYTDKDYIFNEDTVRHHQRMTIGFTFINKKDKDIGIEQIDSVDFRRRLELTLQHGIVGDTFDTGAPAPPPSGSENMAELDIEP